MHFAGVGRITEKQTSPSKAFLFWKYNYSLRGLCQNSFQERFETERLGGPTVKQQLCARKCRQAHPIYNQSLRNGDWKTEEKKMKQSPWFIPDSQKSPQTLLLCQCILRHLKNAHKRTTSQSDKRKTTVEPGASENGIPSWICTFCSSSLETVPCGVKAPFVPFLFQKCHLLTAAFINHPG